VDPDRGDAARPEQTSIHATTEDDSRATAHLLQVSATRRLMGAAAAS
jgi:hypothetical protein